MVRNLTEKLKLLAPFSTAYHARTVLVAATIVLLK